MSQLAFLAFELEDTEKMTYIAGLLGEASGSYDRSLLLNLLLYEPKNARQRELVIGYMGNGDTRTSAKAVQIVKNMTLEEKEYQLVEDMLRFKRSSLRGTLIGLLMEQQDEAMKGCISVL